MALKYKTDYELDSPERTLFHRELILKKTFLKRLYLEWYKVFADEIKNLPSGKIIEIGSGGGFLKEVCPEVISSDILPLPGNDMTFSALDMPFSTQEVSAILMIDTFHHIPDSELFLREANRVLKPGGKIIMIEPANSLWGRFIYKSFHHEPFNPEGSWSIPSTGPLSGANGALPWIVFERDSKKFTALFPQLKVIKTKYHTPLRYLLSGGVSCRQMVPSFTFSFFTILDSFLSFISKELSMFTSIKIEKIK